jgi:hypothetical protein
VLADMTKSATTPTIARKTIAMITFTSSLRPS